MSNDERKYYRSSKDGQLGFLVERDGKKFIQLDRPQEEVLRNFFEGVEWIPEVEIRPLSRIQLAMICFDADRSLCKVLGLHDKTKRIWQDLSDKERIAWMEKGPKTHPIRASIWKALNHILEPLTR